MRRKLVHFSGAPVRQIYPVTINLRIGPRWLPPSTPRLTALGAITGHRSWAAKSR